MAHDQVLPRRVKVNGQLLKLDRKSLRHTRESLVAAANQDNKGFSVSTLQRAENSERVELAILTQIAKVLGQSHDRYVLETGGQPRGHAIANLEGSWRAFYVEDDINLDPYLVDEIAALSQSRDEIVGQLTLDTYEGSRVEILKDAFVRRDLFMGELYVVGWTPPAGFSQFQLQLTTGDDLLDGVTTWYDRDSGRVEWSRYMWVRQGCPDENLLIDKVRRAMAGELEVFKERKKSR